MTRAESSGNFERADYMTWFGFQGGHSSFGFIDSMIFWFPELESVRSYIRLDLSKTVDHAVEAYTEAAQNLSDLCGCYKCDKDYVPPTGLGYDSCTNFTPAKLRSIRNLARNAYWGDIVFLIHLLDLASIYHTAQFPFTTNLYPQEAITTFTAASVGCICFYFNILTDISDEPEKGALLNVLSSAITTPEGRKHAHVTDRIRHKSSGYLALDWREVGSFEESPEFTVNYICNPPRPIERSNSDFGIDTGNHNLKATLLVEESPEGLRVDVDISGSRGSCRVGVYQLLREIIDNSGVVHCSRRKCVAVNRDEWDSILIVDGERKLPEEREDAVYVRRLAGNSLARCIGLLVGKDSWCDSIIFRGKESLCQI
ncbi:hypothetical protein QBC38DRAFT_526386 [Podospora fimiseda]|uniref:Uncharacterized protein n=1 Tax=Podospora fimiseda TaxID=252190 RepID=A0AAN6YJT8_9PEZI|nr:hypothetical protein QBC38DRAFT_526386 [Podospora fimiseda]